MKDCLIIGPFSATWYNDMTPKLISKEVRLGYKGYKEGIRIWHTNQEGEKKPIGAVWYTTLDVKRTDPFIPTATYDKDSYPVYDNYDAIEVKPYTRIPKDYEGKMGVSFTYFFYYPDLDYEIVEKRTDLHINGKQLFQRLIIRKRK